MKWFTDPIRLLSPEEMDRVHAASLRLLEDPGMKLHSAPLLDALAARGAKVDFDQRVVRFPTELVEQTLREVRADRDRPTLPYSIHALSSLDASEYGTSFGGGCISFFDYPARRSGEATVQNMVDMLQLGQALDEVKTVGSPVLYLREQDGSLVDPRINVVRGAAIIAQNTAKMATAEVWNTRQLDYIIEIGCVARGSWEAYRARPCLYGVKECIAPLVMSSESCDILVALVDRGLPCAILSQPLAGASSPVMRASNIALANAEILGAMTALKAYRADAIVRGGAFTGILDMARGSSSFAAPEAALQDLAIYQIHSRRYGIDAGVGTVYIDAKVPGAQASIERTFKIFATLACGKATYSCGIIEGGRTFSPEQAMIDIEIGKCIHRFVRGIAVDDATLAVDLVREVGIGGEFISHPHTLKNYRSELWHPKLLDRGLVELTDLKEDGLVERAYDQWTHVLRTHEPYRLADAQIAEIRRIVASAERELLG